MCIGLVVGEEFGYDYLDPGRNLNPSVVGAGGNVTEFTDLTDTPNSYTGEGDKCVTVKNDETGLEFISCPGGGSGITTYDKIALTNQSNDFGSFDQNTTGFWRGLYTWVVDLGSIN